MKSYGIAFGDGLESMPQSGIRFMTQKRVQPFSHMLFHLHRLRDSGTEVVRISGPSAGNPVAVDMWAPVPHWNVAHIALAEWADAVLVARKRILSKSITKLQPNKTLIKYAFMKEEEEMKRPPLPIA